MFKKEPTRYGSRKWFIKAAFNFSLVWSIVYICGGGLADLERRQAAQITLAFDPDRRIQDIRDTLTGEDWQQIDCLARNAYFEARSQDDEGVQAINDVVFNRIEEPQYPGSVCEVITETGQFSWYDDGKAHIMRDKAQAARMYRLALEAWKSHSVHYKPRHHDLTNGATRYHAFYVAPLWKGYQKTVQIGAHLFYRPKGDK